MRCPECNCGSCSCLNSRPREKSRYRRYRCQSCGHRFSTVEKYVKNGEDDNIRDLLCSLRDIEIAMAKLRRRVRAKVREENGNHLPREKDFEEKGEKTIDLQEFDGAVQAAEADLDVRGSGGGPVGF